ncbi:MAG: hypothetical protein J07HB67_00390 [halophilic archaeon J07HB67]|jgi:hypothetical protein|nr:MAG: hypothetical protein J07HB67_00390 [halophilic archaeon J07HB67]
MYPPENWTSRVEEIIVPTAAAAVRPRRGSRLHAASSPTPTSTPNSPSTVGVGVAGICAPVTTVSVPSYSPTASKNGTCANNVTRIRRCRVPHTSSEIPDPSGVYRLISPKRPVVSPSASVRPVVAIHTGNGVGGLKLTVAVSVKPSRTYRLSHE